MNWPGPARSDCSSVLLCSAPVHPNVQVMSTCMSNRFDFCCIYEAFYLESEDTLTQPQCMQLIYLTPRDTVTL